MTIGTRAILYAPLSQRVPCFCILGRTQDNAHPVLGVTFNR